MPTDFEIRAATVATAFSSLAFLTVALAIGPLMVLRGRRPSRHVEWRRDIGIWAGVLGLVHVLVGLEVHFGGDWRRYFVFGPDEATGTIPFRFDTIGLANWTGLVGTVAFVLLLATSNNRVMRRLGTPRWKSVQRSAYVLFVAVVAHGVVYQMLANRPWPAVALLWAAAVSVVVLQVAGFVSYRREAAGRPPGPADRPRGP
jgi:sulfoxide reductase heme-binding subunit YedZ